jgi:hypothetical protein
MAVLPPIGTGLVLKQLLITFSIPPTFVMSGSSASTVGTILRHARIKVVEAVNHQPILLLPLVLPLRQHLVQPDHPHLPPVPHLHQVLLLPLRQHLVQPDHPAPLQLAQHPHPVDLAQVQGDPTVRFQTMQTAVDAGEAAQLFFPPPM